MEIDGCKTTINELEDQIKDYQSQIEDLTRMMQETEVSWSISLNSKDISM